ESFDFITDYFNARALNIEDEIDLVLFFNNWSRYDLTNKYLLSKFDEGHLNEEAVYILLKTLNFYTKDNEDISDYEEVYQKAFEQNKERWCNWVDKEFQILRNKKIKAIFCQKCIN
ncbi:MAG: hypothetical protein AAGD05_05100, partial [Bacteroidota bacterium]